MSESAKARNKFPSVAMDYTWVLLETIQDQTLRQMIKLKAFIKPHFIW